MLHIPNWFVKHSLRSFLNLQNVKYQQWAFTWWQQMVESFRDRASCVCHKGTSSVSGSNTCAPIVLQFLPPETVVSNFLSPGNAKPCADKEVLFCYLPNFQNIFWQLSLSMKIWCHCGKVFLPGTPLPPHRPEGGRDIPSCGLCAIGLLSLLYIFLFSCTYNCGLILFQLMLTFSMNCIILNCSPFLDKW